MNRREFLTGGAAAAAAGLAAGAARAATPGTCAGYRAAAGGCAEGKCRFDITMAGITYNLPLDQTLVELRKLDVHGLCLKDRIMKYDAPKAEAERVRRQCADAGVTLYGVGPIYMSTEAEARMAFECAQRIGAKVVVGVPFEYREGRGKWQYGNRRLCEFASQLCDEYDAKFAIHTHGTEYPVLANLFPNVYAVYDMVKDLDPRMGVCMDLAYTCSEGYDAAKAVRDVADRLFDMHVRSYVWQKPGRPVGTSLARGEVDLPPVLKALKEVGYAGACGLELGNARPDHPEWLAESVAYFRGVRAALDAGL